MNEQGEGDAERPASSTSAHPQDGSIDFTRYSTEQLRELQYGIDRQAFPQNFANLADELAQRQDREASAAATDGRFSARDGLVGWLEAKGRRAPLYGAGSIEVGAEQVTLCGWRRTWLGAAEQAVMEIALDDIRNVVRDGESVRFEYKRQFPRARQVEFAAASTEAARKLTARLPTTQTPGFEKRWSEVREFNRLIRSVGSTAWVAPAIVVLNILVFAAMTIVERRWGAFEPQVYLNWGANFAPLTLAGQWWRLFTALFVHFDLLHLLLNMWAFWNIGRMTERLYGSWLLLLLYLGAGVLASLTSLLWDPSHFSIGASGAIFGTFGAFLAFLAHNKTRVPMTVVRAHWLSTAAFVAFNLVNGALTPGIDNAAHVGGLLSGFGLGWILARPLDPAEREDFPFNQVLAAAGFVGVAALTLFWQEGGFGTRLSGPQQYFDTHSWYAKGEAANLREWQGLLTRAGAGRIDQAEVADRFEHDILPFWLGADARLRQEAHSLPPEQRPMAALVSDVIRLRVAWVRAIISLERNTEPPPTETPDSLSRQTDYAVARIERLVMRATLDHRPIALANSAWVISLRHLISNASWQCVEGPDWLARSHAGESKSDGPAERNAAGCLAQSMFMAGDYAKLDSLLRRAATSLADLSDGGSTLDGLVLGLDDLFEYGPLDITQALARTSDWRRAVPGSVAADLAEIQVFESWAWSARGTGGANSVSPQAWALFGHRAALAAAGLQDVQERAASNPVWYQLSLSVGTDRSVGVEKLRAIFNAGAKQAPAYLPLYRGMLRILMPRWFGSYEKVDRFIEEVTDQQASADRDVVLYARLYWTYDSLERGDVNIFNDALAVWPLMKHGFRQMMKRYPSSDAVLNAFVKFACAGEDRQTYRELRPLIERRRAPGVWSNTVSVESCDKELPPVTAVELR
jgi:membrane associated rhomboid family serine protease